MHFTLANGPTERTLRSLRTPDLGLTRSPQSSFLHTRRTKHINVRCGVRQSRKNRKVSLILRER
jgi:hypothetical protein